MIGSTASWADGAGAESLGSWAGSDEGVAGEAEAVAEWLDRTELATTELDFGQLLGGLATGAATGATTGMVAGPKGAAIGALIGAGLGAIQAATQSPPAAPAPTAPPRAAQRPVGPPAPPPPPRPSTPPQPANAQPGSTGGIPPQLLQQLVSLLPLLTQALAQQGGAQRAQPSTEDRAAWEAGDLVPDEAFLAEEREHAEGEGIEAPVPEGVVEEAPRPEHSGVSRFVPARFFRPQTNPRAIRHIVIHITDGGANIEGTINWFRNPVERDGSFRPVSAHYVIGQDGEVVQMVRHNDIAFHARGANADSIGIEHVANTRGLAPTDAQYCASAALVRWLCEQYAIPIDREHIRGHSEADPRTTHTGCPNSVWNWEHYMDLVTNLRCALQAATGGTREGSEHAEAEGVGRFNGHGDGRIELIHWLEGADAEWIG